MLRIGIDVGSTTLKAVLFDGVSTVLLPVVQINGRPLEALRTVLAQVNDQYGETDISLAGTGNTYLLGEIGINTIRETSAWVQVCNKLYPNVRSIMQMGLISQNYLLLDEKSNGKLCVADQTLPVKCASGGGSFIEFTAQRLGYTLDEFWQDAMNADAPASVSGRCAVFGESDFIHLTQKGELKSRIASGICLATARNFLTSMVSRLQIKNDAVLIGGLSQNKAVLMHLEEIAVHKIIVPEDSLHWGALGSAYLAKRSVKLGEVIARIDELIAQPFDYPSLKPIEFKRSNRPIPFEEAVFPNCVNSIIKGHTFERAGLGIDIGSTSTKGAVVGEINGKLELLAYYYRRTDGDPLMAVADTIEKLDAQLQSNKVSLQSIVAATTGSGRHLTGDYIGAQVLVNEITAQAYGTNFFFEGPATIIELGGQDGKKLAINAKGHLTEALMNLACAAGTGAFLEKIAARLGVPMNELGGLALQNTKPADLNSQCTVFSEIAMLDLMSRNVAKADLAAAICIASVNNYIKKTARGDISGETIIFQGAPAYNDGMIAAFETVLGREIKVPPLPHLTGPIGAASYAYRSSIKTGTFDFDKAKSTRYERTVFVCHVCENNCQVVKVKRSDGRVFFYNDRCEKFARTVKQSSGNELPDLFAERERILMEFCVTEKKGPEIGIPRGMMFSEYAPLYTHCLSELGYTPIISDPTNMGIVRKGLDCAYGPMCFPAKVAHGHGQDIVDKGIKTIFMPVVHDTEQPNPCMRQSHTCPYVQASADLMSRALKLEEKRVELISPHLHFKWGRKHLEKQFVEVGRQLGKSKTESRRAFKIAYDKLMEFRARVKEYANEVMMNLPKDQMAIVIVGRPYGNWDSVLSMDVGKRIREMGIQAIPQDFLPCESTDITDSWPNAYSRQIAKKLEAARIINSDVRFKAIVLTYFGCGPDSFGNPFFKEELGESCYIMQIDEHTADAGVITRIEAFCDTWKNEPREKVVREPVRSQDTPLGEVKDRTIWIPNMNRSADVLSRVLQLNGFDARPIPLPTEAYLEKAKQIIAEDVCVPAIYTMAAILYRLDQEDFDPDKEGFFMGRSEGPCRFGCYSMLIRIILDKLGYREVPVVVLGRGNEEGGLGLEFPVAALTGIMTYDLLYAMMLKSRPYEVRAGESEERLAIALVKLDEAMVRFWDELKRASKWSLVTKIQNYLGELTTLLACEASMFQRIPKRYEEKPLIGLVGEFYVRESEEANDDIIRRLEDNGFEVWKSPESEFFTYIPMVCEYLAKFRLESGWSKEKWLEYIKFKLNNSLIEKIEHELHEACKPYLTDRLVVSPREQIELGNEWFNFNFGGEPICSMGAAEMMVERGVDAILNVIPFSCMPGNGVAAQGPSFRKKHGVSMITLDYDGHHDSSHDLVIASLVDQIY